MAYPSVPIVILTSSRAGNSALSSGVGDSCPIEAVWVRRSGRASRSSRGFGHPEPACQKAEFAGGVIVFLGELVEQPAGLWGVSPAWRAGWKVWMRSSSMPSGRRRRSRI
jgi:hypothetical protein